MRISQLFAGPYDHGPRATLFERVAHAFSLPDELRQQLILSQRPGWHDLSRFGRPGLALPFRGWLDRRSRRAITDELALFKPNVIAVWDGEAMARLAARPGAPTVGIATDHEAAFALRDCRYLLALSPDIAERAVDRGWPEERVRRLPALASSDLVEPLPRATMATAEQTTVVLLPYPLDGDALAQIMVTARQLAPMTLWMPQIARKHRKLAVRWQVPLRELCPETDRARAVAAADLVLCSAATDAVGLGIVEAWAQTKPVVATGAPAASGLLRDGENGIVAASAQAQDLTPALGRLIDDPLLYDRLAAAGRSAFEAGHGEARALARWLETYLRLGDLILPDSPTAQETRREAPRERTDIHV